MYLEEIAVLIRMWHVLIGRMRKALSSENYTHVADLSTTEISIMQAVEDHTGITPKEVCTLLGIPKSTFTSAADRLKRRNLIASRPSDGDKRSYRLFLTDEGAVAQAEHEALETAVLSALIGPLDRDEVQTLARIIKKAVGDDSDET